MKNKKRTIALCAISASLTLVVSFSAVSLAKYIETKSVGQVVSREGIANSSLFLNANIWNRGDDGEGNIVDAVYYLWVITGAESGYLLSPSKHVTPEISSTIMDLYVFEYKYEWASASRAFVFIRANPSVSISSFTSWPSTAVWNQTHDIPYNAQRNYYCIKDWSVSPSDSKSPYEFNRIDKDGSTLSWGNPSGSNVTITT